MRRRGPRGCQGFCDEMVPRFTDVVGRQWASDFAQVKAASGRFTLLPRSFHQSGPMARLLLSAGQLFPVAGQLFPVARQLLPVTRQLWRWRNGERFGPNGEHFSENGDRFTLNAHRSCARQLSYWQTKPWRRCGSKVERPRAPSTPANRLSIGISGMSVECGGNYLIATDTATRQLFLFTATAVSFMGIANTALY